MFGDFGLPRDHGIAVCDPLCDASDLMVADHPVAAVVGLAGNRVILVEQQSDCLDDVAGVNRLAAPGHIDVLPLADLLDDTKPF